MVAAWPSGSDVVVTILWSRIDMWRLRYFVEGNIFSFLGNLNGLSWFFEIFPFHPPFSTSLSFFITIPNNILHLSCP